MSGLSEAREAGCTCVWLCGFNVDPQSPHEWAERVFRDDPDCGYHAAFRPVMVTLTFYSEEIDMFTKCLGEMNMELVKGLQAAVRSYFLSLVKADTQLHDS